MSDSDLLKLRLLPLESARLDRLLLRRLREQTLHPLSRAQLKDLFKQGRIRLNGKVASASTDVAPGGYDISIEGWNAFIESQAALVAADECFLPIIYEDEDLLILHKTSGTPSVSLRADETRSAAAAALAHFPGLSEIPGTKPLEPGLLHRLDTGTSGLLAFAKSETEFARLKSIWKTPEVRKTYLAVIEHVAGTPMPHTGTLNSPIGRLSSTSSRVAVMDERTRRSIREDLRGAPLKAVTHIHAVRSLSDSKFELEIEIETGVMHQIRAHLVHQGWPILGDKTYHGAEHERLMLHAWKLSLPLRTGARLFLETLPPWANVTF